jgi:mannose-6-phosphate isomerase-like protein (cupin superfamily)
LRWKLGITIVVPANRVHAFRVLGNQPLVTLRISAVGLTLKP